MSNNVYIGSDTTVRLNGLVNQSGTSDTYVTNATVTMTLYEYTKRRNPNRAAATTKAAGAKTGIPVEAHGWASGDYVLVYGTKNYDGEYALDALTSADEIVIVKAYVAETFTGKEVLQRAVANAHAVTVAVQTAATGRYKGSLPDTLVLIHNDEYELALSATDGTNVLLDKQIVRAVYHSE